MDGEWRNGTHVFDLFDGEVSVSRDANCLWSHVDDDHYWSRDEALEELVDFKV